MSLKNPNRKRTFVELDLRENDIISNIGTRAYRDFIGIKLFPSKQIKMLDGKKINNEDGASASQIRSLSEVKGISSALQSEDTVMDNNEFRESCSCLEVNPCVDKYNCKDWANREKIAKDPFENHGDDALFKKCIACVDDSVSSDLVFIEAEGFEIETFWQEVEQKVVNIRNSADSQPFVKLNADGIDLSIFKPLLTCREYAFAVHLANVGIEAIEANDIGPNWFRSLSLVGSPLSTSFVTTNLTMLLYLDVSFSEISLANFDASGLGKLRYLSLEGCSLESLHTGKDDGNEQSHWLSCLESLESLNLSDNEFAVC